jgi:hypothetical protein
MAPLAPSSKQLSGQVRRTSGRPWVARGPLTGSGPVSARAGPGACTLSGMVEGAGASPREKEDTGPATGAVASVGSFAGAGAYAGAGAVAA